MRIFTMVVAAITVMVIVAFIMMLMMTPTGPGCPGDTEWLGFCSEVSPE
jgi:hypothetical protein